VKSCLDGVDARRLSAAGKLEVTETEQRKFSSRVRGLAASCPPGPSRAQTPVQLDVMIKPRSSRIPKK
jgi:hypothetical protein